MKNKFLSLLLSITLVLVVVFSVPLSSALALSTGWGTIQTAQDFETWNDSAATAESNSNSAATPSTDETILFVGAAPSGYSAYDGSNVMQFNTTSASATSASAMININGERISPLHSSVAGAVGKTLEITMRYLVISGTPTVSLKTVAGNIYSHRAAVTTSVEKVLSASSVAGEWQIFTTTIETGTNGAGVVLNVSGANAHVLFDNVTCNLATEATVSFVTNNGTEIDSVTAWSGSDLVLPTLEAEEGKSFAGWYTDATFTQKANFVGFPDEDVTLYAKWVDIGTWGTDQLAQGFETWNDSAATAESNSNSAATPSTDETILFVGAAPSGYSAYDGSNVMQFNTISASTTSASAMININGERISPLHVTVAGAVGKTLEITMRYLVISGTPTVSLKTVAGNIYSHRAAVTTSVEKVLSASSVAGEWQIFTTTIETGAEGTGVVLNVSGANAHVLFDNVTCNLATEATVSFVTNNGTEVKPIKSWSGADFTLPTPIIKTGKVFAGWYTDEELTQKAEFTSFPRVDTTLYAKWTLKEATGWGTAQQTQGFETWLDKASAAGAGAVSTTNPDVLFVGTAPDGYTAYEGSNIVQFNNTDNITASTEKIVININTDRVGTKHATIANGKTTTLAVTMKYLVISGTPTISLNTTNSYLKATNAALTKSAEKTLSTSTTGEWQTFTTTLLSGKDSTGVVLNVSGEGTHVLFDSVSLSVSDSGIATAYNSKAAIRAADGDIKQGIRSYHVIDKDWVDNSNILQYGLLAIRKDKLGDETNLTLNTENAAKAVVWDKTTKPAATLWDDSKQEYIFTSVLTGITPEYYDNQYVVCTYAIDFNSNIIYGEQAYICVYDVVKSILASSNETDIATANAVIQQAQDAYNAGNTEVTLYENWLGGVE